MTFTFADPAAAQRRPRSGRMVADSGTRASPGVAVTFDTYQNGADPSANFIGIATGGQRRRHSYAATNTTIPALRNSTRHVVIRYSGGTLPVSVDGTLFLSQAVSIATRPHRLDRRHRRPHRPSYGQERHVQLQLTSRSHPTRAAILCRTRTLRSRACGRWSSGVFCYRRGVRNRKDVTTSAAPTTTAPHPPSDTITFRPVLAVSAPCPDAASCALDAPPGADVVPEVDSSGAVKAYYSLGPVMADASMIESVHASNVMGHWAINPASARELADEFNAAAG